MDNANIQKWIYGVRRTMLQNGLDDSPISDDQCLDILSALLIPQLPDENQEMIERLNDSWLQRMYFKGLLSLIAPVGELFEGLDIELLRAQLNLN